MTVLNATAIQMVGEAARAAPKAATATIAAEGEATFAQTLATTTGVDAPAEIALGSVHQHSKSGELKPLQKFESFVLRTFVENMLPSENSSFFGTGTAGQIWKSMLAERIGDEMAASGGIGIADLLKDHEPSVKATASATPAFDVTSLGKTPTE